MALAAAQAVQLFSVALLIGFMIVVEWSLVPAQNRLDARGYAVLEQGMNRVLTRLTPTLMIAGLGASAACAALAWADHRSTVTWHLLTVAGLVVMIISTLIINAPINREIDTWDPESPPATWQRSRDRWEAGHRLRSYVGLGVLGCVILAAVG